MFRDARPAEPEKVDDEPNWCTCREEATPAELPLEDYEIASGRCGICWKVILPTE